MAPRVAAGTVRVFSPRAMRPRAMGASASSSRAVRTSASRAGTGKRWRDGLVIGGDVSRLQVMAVRGGIIAGGGVHGLGVAALVGAGAGLGRQSTAERDPLQVGPQTVHAIGPGTGMVEVEAVQVESQHRGRQPEESRAGRR